MSIYNIPPQDSEEFTECLFKNYEKSYFIKNVITPKIISEYGLLEHCLKKNNTGNGSRLKYFEKFLNIALQNKDTFDYSTVASEALWVLMEDSLLVIRKIFFEEYLYGQEYKNITKRCKKWIDDLLELSADTDLIDYYYREMYYSTYNNRADNIGSRYFLKSLLKSKNRLDIFKFNIRKWSNRINITSFLLEIKDIDYNKDFSDIKELCQNYDTDEAGAETPEDKIKNKGLVTIYNIMIWCLLRNIEKGCYNKHWDPFIDECTKRHMSDEEYSLYREPEHNISDILITEKNYKLISAYIYYMCKGYITFDKNTKTCETQLDSKDRLYQQIKEENYKFENFNIEQLFYNKLEEDYIYYHKMRSFKDNKELNSITSDEKKIIEDFISSTKVKLYDDKHKKKLREYVYDILDKKVLYRDLNKLIVSYL